MDFQDIVYAVSAERGIDPLEIVGPCRKKETAHARQEVAYIARVEKGMTVADIGLRIHRDHTTVLHSVNAVIGRMMKNDEYGLQIDAIVSRLTPSLPAFKSVRATK